MPAAARLAPWPAVSRSKIATLMPLLASRQPMLRPATPAPMMANSVDWIMGVSVVFYRAHLERLEGHEEPGQQPRPAVRCFGIGEDRACEDRNGEGDMGARVDL